MEAAGRASRVDTMVSIAKSLIKSLPGKLKIIIKHNNNNTFVIRKTDPNSKYLTHAFQN